MKQTNRIDVAKLFELVQVCRNKDTNGKKSVLTIIFLFLQFIPCILTCSICRKISIETKFYLEHVIIYFERTILVITDLYQIFDHIGNVIKYLIKGGSHSKQAWVDILSLRKHDNAMLGHPDMFWFDTRGVTHGDTWGHLKQWNSVMPGR